jgi:hypothetical protein
VSLSAGVIAAGRGDRLRDGSQTLKPLVRVGGRTLIERVLASVGEAAPAEVVIIINEDSTEVRDHVSALRWPFAVRWIVETTPSSMHSFLRVVETLAGSGEPGPFLLSGNYGRRRAHARFAAQRRAAAVTLRSPCSRRRPSAVRRLDDRGRRDRRVAAPSGARPQAYAVRASILREADARAAGRRCGRSSNAARAGYRLDSAVTPA